MVAPVAYAQDAPQRRYAWHFCCRKKTPHSGATWAAHQLNSASVERTWAEARLYSFPWLRLTAEELSETDLR